MKLAIDGGVPVRTKPWPKWPIAPTEVYGDISNILDSDRWTLTGQSEIETCYSVLAEKAWANFVGTKYSVACSSGSAGLYLALSALDIGDNDEVIVPSLTWVACPKSIQQLHAEPVFCDIDLKSFCLDPNRIERLISEKTKAILLVHAYSSVADMEMLMQIAANHNLFIIEDCSQAHGAVLNDKRIGSFGDIAVFSLHQSKLLTCGEGGICTTNNESLFEKMVQLRTDGRLVAEKISPHNLMLTRNGNGYYGRNLVLPEISAAILLRSIPLLDEQLCIRRQNIEYLQQELDKYSEIKISFKKTPKVTPSPWRLPIVLEHLCGNAEKLQFVSTALSKEINLPVERIDAPFNINPLIKCTSKRTPSKPSKGNNPHCSRNEFHLSTKAYSQTLSAPHYFLLGSTKDMDDFVGGLVKILRYVN